MIKEVIQQEVIRILNVYEPKKKKSLKRMEHICIREKEKKWKTRTTNIHGDVNFYSVIE